jgi:hypothetical protein
MRAHFEMCYMVTKFTKRMLRATGMLCASRPSRYVSVINDNHLVSLMNLNAAKVI